ncbi:diacylglycerol kinase family protein [Hoeflea sp. CAU 1731]
MILNPAAGRGKAARVWSEVESDMRAAIGEFGFRATKSGADIKVVASEALKDGYRRIVGVGGDGTMGLLMNAIMANGDVPPSDVVMGQIPCGTVNVVANCLGLSTPRQAVEALAGNSVKPVDVMRLDAAGGGDNAARHGFVIVSVGLPVEASKLTARMPFVKLLGGASYVLAGVLSVLGGRPRQFDFFADAAPPSTVRAWGYFVCNFPGLAGEISFAPEAQFDDGLLDCVEVGPVSRGRMLAQILPAMKDGSYVRKAGMRVTQGRVFRIETPAPMQIEIDGEPAGVTPATVSVVPGAINMIFADQ